MMAHGGVHFYFRLIVNYIAYIDNLIIHIMLLYLKLHFPLENAT